MMRPDEFGLREYRDRTTGRSLGWYCPPLENDTQKYWAEIYVCGISAAAGNKQYTELSNDFKTQVCITKLITDRIKEASAIPRQSTFDVNAAVEKVEKLAEQIEANHTQ